MGKLIMRNRDFGCRHCSMELAEMSIKNEKLLAFVRKVAERQVAYSHEAKQLLAEIEGDGK